MADREPPGTARLQLRVADDSPWLDGHFPDRPVLPGVVLLRWAIGASGILWPSLDIVTRVSNLKFRRPVLPPADLDLELIYDADRGHVDFLFARDGTPSAQGRVGFA